MNRNKQVTQNGNATEATLDYREIAAVMEQALDTIVSVMPRFALVENSSIAYVRRRLGVTPEMIASAITASEISPLLQPFIDVPGARDTLALKNTLRPVFDRINGIAEDLKFVMEARLVKTGGEALDVYAAAKRVAQGNAEVAAHLQNMVDAMPKGKGPRRKKVTSDSTEPPPPSEPPENKPSS